MDRLKKKGLRYTIIIGLIIGSVILIATVYMWAKYGDILIRSHTKQTNSQTLKRIAASVDMLMKNDKNFAYDNDVNIYVHKDYAIVGFNMVWDESLISDGCHPYEPMPKPQICKRRACICLYSNSDEDFSDMKLEECISLKGVDYINSIHLAYVSEDDNDFDDTKSKYPGVPEEVYKNQVGYRYNDDHDAHNYYPIKEDYSPFVLYGQCDGWWDDENLDLRSFYVEKYKQNDKTAILISYSSEHTKKRIEQLGT